MNSNLSRHPNFVYDDKPQVFFLDIRSGVVAEHQGNRKGLVSGFLT